MKTGTWMRRPVAVRRSLLCIVIALAASCTDASGGRSEAPGAPEQTPSRASPPADAPNVLLVTIDTLRADHLPAYGYAGVRTPFLDRVAREGVVFEQCDAHAPITLPSHTSILTGLYPPEHGVRNNGTSHAGAELETLAERYTAHGYDTAAFVSAFVLDSRFGLDQGFAHYDDDLEDGRQRWSVFGVKDRIAENTVSRVEGWLESRAEKRATAPFFVWVHLYDPHFEYEPPEPFRSLYAHPYDGEIAYTDYQLGRLWDALGALELQEDTLLAVTADHGESLGQHGESTHSLFVYQATQHVPLFVRLPGAMHGGRRVPQLVRHVDIAPTLIDLSGLAGAERTWLEGRSGRSLRGAVEGGRLPPQPSYAEAYLPKEQFGWSALHAVREGSRKYIEAPRPELYDLSADPEETHNLHDEAAAKPLEGLLSKFRARERWQSGHSERALDEESRAKLKALGYIADEAPDPEQAGADPKDMSAIYEARERIHQAMNAGQYQAVIPDIRELLTRDPDNVGLIGDLAACLAELSRWEEAEAAFTKMAKLRPQSAAAHMGLAKVAFKGRRDFARAEEELEAALALSPHDPSLHGLEGDLLHEQGKLEAAVKSYAKAVEAGDQTPSYFVGYASALNLTGQLEEARTIIERAIRMDRRNPVAHHNHGVILENLQLYAAASGAYDEAIHNDPTLGPSVLALARLLTQRGRPEQAQAVLQGGLRARPDDPQLLGELGAVQLRTGQVEEATELLKRSVAAAPNDARTRTNLGFALETAGQLDEAYAQYGALAQGAPPGSRLACDAALRLGRVRVLQGRPDDARPLLTRANACGGETTLTILGDPRLRAVIAAE